jgi:lipopolysaccharide export system protein LptA
MAFVIALCLSTMAMLGLGLWQPSASAISPALSPQGGGSRAVDIRADNQTYNADTGESVFTGRVRLTFNNVEITSSRASVQMGSNGTAGLATFQNRPLVKHTVPGKGQDVLQGDLVDLDLSGTMFRARGNVVSTLATVAAMPIAVNADVQQYDTPSGLITASGRVRVRFNNTNITSGKAVVRMEPNGQADRVVFSGGSHLIQPGTDIHSDRMTVTLANSNLVAEGGVKTVVATPDTGSRVLLNSAVQQFDNTANVVLASGAVQLFYQDYIATGPKASFSLKTTPSGKTIDRVVMTGRPTIVDKDRKITANQIVITPNPKKFDATGNVQTAFKSKPASTTANGPSAVKAKPLASPAKTQLKPSKPGKTPAPPTAVVAPSLQTEEDELQQGGVR